MPRLRWFRVLAAVAFSIVAGCSAPAPPPGPPEPSAVALYTLAESNRGKLTDINHGKPTDIGWHAASGTFLVATYNDGTIYRGRLADPDVPVYMTGKLGETVSGIAVAGDLLYAAGSISGQIRVYDLVTKTQVGRFETGSGGKVLDLVVTGSGDVWATDRTRPVLYVLGACQLFRTSLARTAGPFDESVFLGWDDADWCIRIRDAGGEIVYFPEASVIHSYRRLTRKQPVSHAALKMLSAHVRFQWKYRRRRRELIRLGNALGT